jgi:hypothetical protein
LEQDYGPIETIDDIDRLDTALYDSFRASGGYFRNGYNAGDVMWAMGLSWSRDVGKMLDANRQLPIDRVQELIAKIEARPLTREVVARHIFEHMSDGCCHHPISGFGGHGPPPDLDEMSTLLRKRRDELLIILRKSVELGEPLICSL